MRNSKKKEKEKERKRKRERREKKERERKRKNEREERERRGRGRGRERRGEKVGRGGRVGGNLTRGVFSVRKYGIFTILICNCKLPYTCHFVIFFKTKS